MLGTNNNNDNDDYYYGIIFITKRITKAMGRVIAKGDIRFDCKNDVYPKLVIRL